MYNQWGSHNISSSERGGRKIDALVAGVMGKAMDNNKVVAWGQDSLIILTKILVIFQISPSSSLMMFSTHFLGP
eukprot:15137010-Ditylum_brightwellii.AAC.1